MHQSVQKVLMGFQSLMKHRPLIGLAAMVLDELRCSVLFRALGSVVLRWAKQSNIRNIRGCLRKITFFMLGDVRNCTTFSSPLFLHAAYSLTLPLITVCASPSLPFSTHPPFSVNLRFFSELTLVLFQRRM